MDHEHTSPLSWEQDAREHEGGGSPVGAAYCWREAARNWRDLGDEKRARYCDKMEARADRKGRRARAYRGPDETAHFHTY